MKREVAELSGNFRRELSSQDEGEGNRSVFSLCKELWNTRRRVKASDHENTLKNRHKTPCTRIAKTVQNNSGGKK